MKTDKLIINRVLSHIGLLALVFALSACGGGGGGTSTSVTPSGTSTSGSGAATDTVAPVANTSSSNQLASSVSIRGYSSLSVAQLTTTSTTSSTRTAFNRVLQNLAGLFVKNSVAQASSTCTNSTDIMKLVGISSDGSVTPISVTLGADACGVGFLDMFDAKNYILLVG